MTSTAPASSEEDFAALLENMSGAYTYLNPRRGDLREAVVVGVRPGEIIVDIGAKEDAFVAAHEIETMPPEEFAGYNVGDRILVCVLRFDSGSGALLVSLRLAAEQRDWVEVEKSMESGELQKVRVTGYNKGGLLADLRSLQGFIPASQVVNLARRPRDEDLSDDMARMVGAELVVKVIEVSRRRRRLILSEREAEREWRELQRERLLGELAEGQLRKGVVRNLVDFGAFVDLGGIDGLVHLSEISWQRVNHPREALRIGQEVEVLVLNVDRERGRIGLSLKRTQADPWETMAERYREGQVVEGTVSHLAKFGAFVELEPGVEGLVHLSELAPGDLEAANGLQPGERRRFLILNVDAAAHRIALSLRQAAPDEAPQPGDDAAAPAEPTADAAQSA